MAKPGTMMILPDRLEVRRVRRDVNADYIRDLLAYSKLLFQGGLAPKDVSRPETIAAMIEVGRDLGLSDTQAIQSVKIVAGRPSIYGDTALALVRESGKLADFEEGYITDDAGNITGAFCRSRRVGDATDRRSEFTIEDAERANLWGKKGPWTEYWPRMLMFRARGFNLRDQFPDVLCGLVTFEELRDSPKVTQADIESIEPEPVKDAEQIPDAEASPVAAATTEANAQPSGQPAEATTAEPKPAEAEATPVADEKPATPITAKQLAEFAKLYPLVLAADAGAKATDDEQAKAWGDALEAVTGKRSAKLLTSTEAAAAIEAIGEKYDPFEHPKKKATT